MASLYACLRLPRTPGLAVAVAQEFSPRLQRYGSDDVVLDVGGLGRLFGTPQAIGDALASRIADLFHGTRISRIADPSHGTRISRIADPSHETRISRIADLSHGTRISPIADPSHGTRISRITGPSYGTRIVADRQSAEDLEKDSGRSAKSASREKRDLAKSASREKDLWRSTSREERDSAKSAFSVAVAPTQVGAMLLSLAYPGLTVAAEDVAAALAPVCLEVLRHVYAEIHGLTMFSNDPRESASRPNVQRSAESASCPNVQRSAESASRPNVQRSAESASRLTNQRSAGSASRRKDQRCEQAFETLQRWGLATLGEMAVLPAGALSARLGQPGIVLQRMASGVDSSPLVPDPDVPRFLERVELEWPIDGLEPLAFVLARLLDPLSAALERADRGAAALHLNLRLVDRTEHTRVLQLPAALRDPKVLRTLLVLDLESHPPQAAIDIITIEVDPAPGRVLQYSLLERARPSDETLATLIARLGALAGESRVGQPVLLDSHRPDAFEMRRFAPDEKVRPDNPVSRPDDPVAAAFRRNDALESGVLRRFRPPIAIRVLVERGRPRHVFIDRRGMPGGRVEQCAGPWRSSGSWWKEWGEARRGVPGGAIRPWHRDEWDVALGDGSVCRLFQARDTEQWFLDGVVD
jgi:protein ImuB